MKPRMHTDGKVGRIVQLAIAQLAGHGILHALRAQFVGNPVVATSSQQLIMKENTP